MGPCISGTDDLVWESSTLDHNSEYFLLIGTEHDPADTLCAMVELALFEDPRHPYTQALLSAMPSMDPDNRATAAPITGDPPNPINPPSGCRFHTRCPHAEKVCSLKSPDLRRVAQGSSHLTACHMAIPESGHSAAPAKAAA